MKKIILLLFTLNCFSQAGTFDTTFDTDGIQTYCLTPLADMDSTTAGLQATGKIIQLCFSNNYTDFNFIRYNTDGSIDSSFGNNGVVSFTNNSLFQGMGRIVDFTLQSDDKILIVGDCSAGTFVARLLPDGVLDTSFNGVGYMSFDFTNFQEIIGKIIVQPDGNILVGASPNAQYLQQYLVARITTSGILDPTFGSGGKALITFNINLGHTNVNSMTVQPDGKIVVEGSTVNNATGTFFKLVRFNPNGAVDTTFGTDGIVTTSDIGSSSAYASKKLIVQPDGKIVAGGIYFLNGNKMAMLRYLPNGALDPTFGTGGIVATNEFSDNYDVAMQTDGKFILVGGSNAFKVFRYTTTGVLDTTFANNANVFGVGEGHASTVLIQNDHKIVVCGDTYNLATIRLCAAIIRLNNDVLGTEGFAKSELSVSPNPVQNQLSVSNKNTVQYELYSILGAKIAAGTLAPHGQLDCSGLAKGLYLLKLKEDGGESKVVKVVKE